MKKNISNIIGWHTKRKIVVIESDDWGTIRMPSRLAYNKLSGAGLNLKGVDALRYSLYDTLASCSDLEMLFNLLLSIRDSTNHPAVFTAVSVVANPDFEKIRNGGFQKYFYEPFNETLKRYFGDEDSFKYRIKGISEGIFKPQFHGREHLNVIEWMKALRANDVEARLAFSEGTWAYIPKRSGQNSPDFLAAYKLSELNDLKMHEEILIDGLQLFQELFGIKAEYFVPPNGVVNNKINVACYNNGVRFRSSSKIQNESIEKGRKRRILHWLGQKDSTGIRYITRNCVFEPSIQGMDWVDSCLNDVKIAFRWHQPAIIGTHRVNYIGSHFASNRDKGLQELRRLLKSIKRIWPDVEFMTTVQMGSIMELYNSR